MYETEDDRNQIGDPCEYMAQLAQNVLPLERWGFKESYRSTKEECLIFDSEWCRVKFVWGGWELYTGYHMSMDYGRLHAPSDAVSMIWNGEECRCWHGLTGTSPVLDFLDGLSPQESSNFHGLPPAIEQYVQSELWETLDKQKRHPESTARMHALIWERYGTRLFELFDLRRPDLWEQYRQWLRAHYVAKGNSEERDKQFGITVPYYRVC
jgi:hypothetical protein